MLKTHKLLLFFNAAVVLVCLFWGYRYFQGAGQLVGNNVVYITAEPGRRAGGISLDIIKNTADAFEGYNVAFEILHDATLTNNSRSMDVTLTYTNHTYFSINNYFFLHGGGWPEGFNRRNVIVLSENAAWELFGNTNALSLHVEIDGLFFEVCGVIRQSSLDEPGFAWVPYNHRAGDNISGAVSSVSGIYIQGRGYNSLERLTLAGRFADTADLRLGSLRFVDLEQYAYNIFVKFNLFALLITISALIFFAVKFYFVFESEITNKYRVAFYGSFTIISGLLCVYLWQSTSANLPFTPVFELRPLIDRLNNANTFEGIGSLSFAHQALQEYNRLSIYPLIIGAFAFVNILSVFLADAFVKYRHYVKNRGPRPAITLPEYVMKRILQIIPSFLIMTAVIFFGALLMPTPGMPHFPTDAHIRFLRYIFAVLQGDFGASSGISSDGIAFGASIRPFLVQAIGYTAILVFGAILVAAVLGVGLGVLAALKQNKITDSVIMVATIFTSAIPIFFLGIILMLIFSLYLQLLPSRGLEGWQGMILPILTLALPSIGFIARTTRTAMLEVLTMDCIKAARARGLPERIILSHALGNMRVPIITAISLRLVDLFMGTVLVEALFSIRGIGWLMLAAINARELSVLMNSIVFLILAFMVINLIADLLCIIVDPRTRRGFK